MIQELDSIALEGDLPEYGLVSGDLGTIVLVHRVGAGYEVEFFSLRGETIAVVTLSAAQIRPLNRFEIAHARPVEFAHV